MLLSAPVIKFFSKANRSPGSGTAGDADSWELGGSAVANSLVSLFDGNSLLGTTAADATGAWTFETGFDSIGSFTAMATDAAGNISPLSLPFKVAGNAQEAETRQGLFALAMMPSLTGAASLLVNDTADHIINATESTAVAFTVSGLAAGATGAVTFSDASNHQVVVNVDGNGAFSANLSGLTDGAITSVLSAADKNGLSTTTAGNTVSLDTDSSLNPSLSVNAADPSNVVFTVSGLESDYSGKVTFTDATGKSDVVPIGANGTYSANLSNLANGTLTYLMTVSDPAGNVINVDPTVTLGDGSANAPAGAAQLPTLLSGYQARPSWYVAGVDYAVGYGSTHLTDWESISIPGVTVNTSTNTVTITGNDVNLNGIDFSLHGGAQLIVNGSNDVVSNCNFLYGATMASQSRYYIISGSGKNLTIEDSVLDGNGPTLGQAAANQSSLITFSGGLTLEYNWFKNFNQHVLEYNASTNTSLIYEYNLITNGGSGATGQHLNYLQLGTNNCTTTVTLEFNTTYQPTTPVSGGEGFQLGSFGTGGAVNATVAYNTMIYGPNGEGRLHINETSQYPSNGGTTAQVYDNYFFTNGTAAFYSDPYAGQTDFYSNNVDMAAVSKLIQANNTEVSQTKITNVLSSPSTGTEFPGSTITLTLALSAAVTVSGTPTLSLNDGGTATYVAGSGTNALIFSYTVGTSDSTVSALAITQVNLPSGATVKDANGNTPDFTAADVTLSGLAIDPPPAGPTISSLAESPASGDLNTGKTVTLTLNLSGAVTVAGGTPTLTLNDGGTATYTGGSGSSALTFIYTVGSSDTNVAALSATAVNLNGATIKDGSGNAASLSLSGITQAGPQIDTTTPTVSSVAASGTGITAGAGDLGTGSVVTLTVNLSEAVTVAGGTPTLTLNDGGTASYSGGSGSKALTFSYTVAAGQNTSDLAVTAVSLNGASVTNGAGTAANLAGAVASPSGTLQIDTTTPTVSSVAASGTGITAGTGDIGTGSVVTLTVNLNEAVTVAGGTPTLTLDDGATATYTGGSGTNALIFSYTVGAGQNTPDLAVSAVNLNGATVKNGAGTAANLAGAVTTPSGTLQIDTTAPTVSQVTASPGTGTELLGNTVSFTLAFSEAVSVTGTPTLSLNDGGTATYTGGSGTNALTFSYTVGANDSAVSSLAITQANLPSGASIKDGAGNAANLAGALATFSGLATAPPVVPRSVAESPSSGDLDAGKTVTLTLNLSGAVTVAGGTPTLTLNDGGTATYTGGSGTSALTFSYTVGSGDTSVASLAATAVNLNGATVKDSGGNAASLSLTGLTQTGPQIDTTAPVISAIAETPANGDLNAGKIVTYSLTMSEAVTVNTTGGKPTLALNDGGTATYVSGSGSNTLTFSYTVQAGQNTPDLMVSAFNLNGSTVTDGAGNTANLSLTGIAQGSPQIDTTTPTVASVAASGTGITSGTGDVGTGSVVTLTVNLSEAVAVAGGTPTLTLNDGGTATYSGGSGTSALTFSYKVAAGQNTADLAVTAVNLNGASVQDGAGNAANLSGAVTNPAGTLQVDTTTPTVSSVVTSGTGIKNGASTLGAGAVVTLTVNLSEAVAVAGGTPTLSLNDGGTATCTGGSGTNALTFSYTVLAGQSTNDLAVTAFNLNGATVEDGLGNAANLAGAITNPQGKLKIYTGTQKVVSTSTTVSGTTSLVSTGSEYALNTSGSTAYIGPELSYNGAPVTAGEFPWTPIAAVQTASGYDVAWQMPGTNLYTIWSTDSSGNYLSNLAPVVAGNSTALEAFETTFQQDLNGDGVTGVKTVPIQTDGTTTLAEYGNNYALNTVGSSTTGPLLTYNGSVVTVGEFPWTPIGAVQTASGYDVAWQMPGTNLYTIWSTDSSGNYLSNLAPVVAGNSTALEAFETTFQQDLNGDGVITIPSGQSMELTGSYAGEIAFGGTTGTLKIDHAADFTGTIGGPLTPTDQIDFADVNFNSVTLGYSGNNSPGTLTVSDGTHTASLAVLGDHSLANFTASSDGHGGTIVVDPPLTGGVGGSLDQQVALLSQYMASAFPGAGVANGATAVDSSKFGSGLIAPLASPAQTQQHASMLN